MHRRCSLLALATLTLGSLPGQAPPQPGTLAPTAPVALRLATPDGAPRACTVDLARYDGPDRPLRTMMSADGFTPRQLTANDFATGTAALRDLPRGTFVLVVAAERHARAVSEPFRVGDQPTEVTVQLVVGATVSGRVLDEAGKPVAGATITSDGINPPDPTTDSVLGAFWQPVPRLTQAQVLTDAQGRFELPHLALGLYSVRVGHAHWCPHQQDLPEPLADRERRDLGTITLRQGAQVLGRIVDLRKRCVELTLFPPEGAGSALQPVHARSMPDGTFTFLQRVPPGRYQLLGEFAEDDTPFTMRRLVACEVPVEVLAGQREVVVPPLVTR